MSSKQIFIDVLYGDLSVGHELGDLIRLPVLQRLRHVRLSNIDSVTMPGISGLTRYEHVLGVGHLAQTVGYFSKLSRLDQIGLQAAGFLHDWAITAFGHLVEEGFSYVGTKFDHEEKLYELIMQEDTSEVGGLNRQIFCGRETGFNKWARRVAGEDADQLIRLVTEAILGKGRLGRIIAGDIDLDNIDNVIRVAFHMGIPVDKQLPLRLAASVIGLESNSGAPVFARTAQADIEAWLCSRSEVYTRLMLAETDFSAKLMVLWSVVSALRTGEISSSDWNLTDFELVQRLRGSTVRETRETIERWLTGEYWDISELVWVKGEKPSYKEMMSFSESLTDQLGRHCFAYAIKDKRDRRLAIHFDDGETNYFGRTPNQWLLGIGSAKKRPFSSFENIAIARIVEENFGQPVIGHANPMNSSNDSSGDGQLCLL